MVNTRGAWPRVRGLIMRWSVAHVRSVWLLAPRAARCDRKGSSNQTLQRCSPRKKQDAAKPNT